MSVRIVTDSTADIRPGLAEKIPFASLMIRFGDEEFIDGVNMSRKEFYEHLAVCKDLPTTSQPSPDAFEKIYKEAIAAGDQVVVLTISSKLSGTYQSANIAAMDYPGQVYVVDTLSTTIGAGILAERAMQLADSGMSAEELVAVIEEEKTKLTLFATLDTLEYLVRGGRLSKVAGFAGGLLNLKPVITLRDGVIEVVGKARGTKQGNLMMAKEIEKSGGIDFSKPILAGYTGLNDELLQKYLADSAEQLAEAGKIDSTCISGTIGTHVGPGAYAIVYFKN